MMRVKIDFFWGGTVRIFLAEKGTAGQISLRNTSLNIPLNNNLSIYSSLSDSNLYIAIMAEVIKTCNMRKIHKNVHWLHFLLAIPNFIKGEHVSIRICS